MPCQAFRALAKGERRLVSVMQGQMRSEDTAVSADCLYGFERFIALGIINLLSGLSSAHLVCDTRPMGTLSTHRYKNHRFPVETINYGVWRCFRFCMSQRVDSWREIMSLLTGYRR
jgi:hypothetical protein